jgi:hypothetical protein
MSPAVPVHAGDRRGMRRRRRHLVFRVYVLTFSCLFGVLLYVNWGAFVVPSVLQEET